jgi:hypothetical protein
MEKHSPYQNAAQTGKRRMVECPLSRRKATLIPGTDALRICLGDGIILGSRAFVELHCRQLKEENRL